MTLRVVFMGTPTFAVPVLDRLVAEHAVAAVYTRPPAASGRGLKPKPSPVQILAEAHGIPVENPSSLKGDAAAATLAEYRPDLAVVVAYGMLLPRSILDVPRLGCLNLHASLLPRWRGAAPIQRAVMAGDPETGVAVMRMEEGLDTGPVAAAATVAIGPDETSGELHDRLAVLGAGLMSDVLAEVEAGRAVFTRQPEEGVTYARKITNEEARIDWAASAGAVHDQVRGLSPWPGAFFEAELGRDRERVKVLRTELAEGAGEPGRHLGEGIVACGSGAVRLSHVQRSGRGPVTAAEFLRGVRLERGATLA
jgi:methionyl-tRNA formyltransferase